MARPISLQVYVSLELGERVRKAAARQGMSVSEWLRSQVIRACDEGEYVARHDAAIERISRQSMFVMVGVDALLAGHPDHGLRERARQAFTRKCKQAGLAASTDEGGSHEA